MVESTEHAVDDFTPGQGLQFVDGNNKPIEGLSFKVELPDGKTLEGETKEDGIILVPQDEDGDIKVTIILEEDETADAADDTDDPDDNTEDT